MESKEEWHEQIQAIYEIIEGYDQGSIRLIQERLFEFIDIAERLEHEEVGQSEEIILRHMQTELKTWIYEKTNYLIHDIY